MLPGFFVEQINVTSSPVTIVGTDATIGSFSNVVGVPANRQLHIRGLTFDLTRGPMTCGVPPSQPGGTLILRDVTVIPAQGNTIRTFGCSLTMRQVKVRALDARPFEFEDNSTIRIERSHIAASFGRGNYGLLMGSNIKFSASDSVFDEVPIVLDLRDTTTTSTFNLAFSTMVATSSIGVYRQSANGLSSRIENNIIWLTSADAVDAITCPANECIVHRNVLLPQNAAVPSSNLIEDPRLQDRVARDFRLRSDSPALDSAMPTAGFESARDIEGTARPQGEAADIGAFERVP